MRNYPLGRNPVLVAVAVEANMDKYRAEFASAVEYVLCCDVPKRGGNHSSICIFYASW